MKMPNIRFNLKFYGLSGQEEVVRTLGELQEKFNLSDLYDYFKEGVLERWLVGIGEQQVSDNVRAIHEETDVSTQISNLVAALSLECAAGLVEDVASIQRRKDRVLEENVRRSCELQRASDNGVGRKSYRDLILELAGVFSQQMGRDLSKYSQLLLPILRELMRTYDERFLQDLSEWHHGWPFTAKVYALLWWNRKWGWYLNTTIAYQVVFVDSRGDLMVRRAPCEHVFVEAADRVYYNESESAEQYWARTFGWED